MSESTHYEEVPVQSDVEDFFEQYNTVEPLSNTELALFAGLVTLPQAVASQPAFDSLMQPTESVYARPAFTSSMQHTEPTINGTAAFSSVAQPNEPAFLNTAVR